MAESMGTLMVEEMGDSKVAKSEAQTAVLTAQS